MQKVLLTSETEYLEFFSKLELHVAERFLQVEFAYEDGTFLSDDYSVNDGKGEIPATNRFIYRKTENSVFPESYPCIMLFVNDTTNGRAGELTVRMLDFVYISDFGDVLTQEKNQCFLHNY